MRMNYPLTQETRTVLTDNVKQIACEMDVDTSYLYQMLSSVECDSFARFKRLYDAVVRAGGDTSPWDAAFRETKARYRADHAGSAFARHILASGETNAAVAEALDDGVIDERERRRILRKSAAERDALDALECDCVASDLRAYAREAVNGRNGTR